MPAALHVTGRTLPVEEKQNQMVASPMSVIDPILHPLYMARLPPVLNSDGPKIRE